MKLPKNRDEALALDATDPLADKRDMFHLPDDVVYLVGHSLGPSSYMAIDAVKLCLDQEWRTGLVESWNSAGWFDMAKDLGGAIAPLIGVSADEVMITDTVSINLFKLAGAALPLVKTKAIFVDADEFPTDQYMADSLASLKNIPCHRVSEEAAALNSGGIYIKSAVGYRNSTRIDMKAYETQAGQSGTLIIWDLSHATGVIALDLQAAGARLATGCTYKYLNAGPGAPSFVYVAKSLSRAIVTPLPGWMGHARPFAFEGHYTPAKGVTRFASGTPPILSLSALKGALACFEGISVSDLEHKTGQLGDLCTGLARKLGVKVTSPLDSAKRGGHVSIEVGNGYAISRALHDRGFHTDFRTPSTIRFGLSPLYIRFVDIWDVMQALSEIITNKQWDKPKYLKQNKVT